MVRIGDFDFSPSLLVTIATLCLLCLLCSLGLWQLGRGELKEQMQGQYERRARDVPLSIDASQIDADSLRFRSVTALGDYDGDHQFLLDNRTYRGVAGYHVLTPLRLKGEAVGVLVNRGWVPVGETRDRLPETDVPEGLIEVRGIVAVPPTETILLGPSGFEDSGWPRVIQRIELNTMGAQLGYVLLPYTVLLEKAQPDGFVREWRPYYGITPERHRAYAFQWFSLGVALLIIYIAVNIRRRGTDEIGGPNSGGSIEQS